MHQRVNEGLFVLIVALSLFILMSLFSYRYDNSLSALSSGVAGNAGGAFGAWLSRLLLVWFGYLAYVLPFGLCYCSFNFVKQDIAKKSMRNLLWLRLIGFILLILAACGLASLGGDFSYEPYSHGGIIGLYVAYPFFQGFSFPGSVVLLVAIGLFGMTLLTNIAWLDVLEKLGKHVLLSVKKLRFFLIEYKQLKALKRKEKKALFSEPVPIKVRKYTRASKKTLEAGDKTEPEPMLKSPVEVKVSARYEKERQQNLFAAASGKGELPPLSLLSLPKKSKHAAYSNNELEQKSREVEEKLLDFGIDVQVVAVHPGPVITRYELQLAPGLKVSKLTTLGKDLARSLSVTSVRVVEVIPGKPVVGLELPNVNREVVSLSEVLSTERYDNAASPLSLALGVDIAGAPMIVDLAKMPHLLVAGTTGSGKSVGVNAMILSLLFKSSPEEVRLILVDPKMLELSIYEGIPHLLTPVVTDMKDAANALRWSVMEMERRYRLMAALGVRNIASFNKKVKESIKNKQPIQDPLWQPVDGEMGPELTTLPSIVVVIDELADMMMVVGKKVEQLIARIAQKARAAGIHLILATQRPSVDVLTGLIKSNIPTRISFQVSSKIDSRTILDQQGADQLLGHGDMLYLPPGSGNPVRVHGAFVEDNEVHRVVAAWKNQTGPSYIEEITQVTADGGEFAFEDGAEQVEDKDSLYDEVVEFVTQSRKASISAVQRRFKIGYNRAARLVDELERIGVVGPLDGTTREVLAPPPVED